MFLARLARGIALAVFLEAARHLAMTPDSLVLVREPSLRVRECCNAQKFVLFAAGVATALTVASIAQHTRCKAFAVQLEAARFLASALLDLGLEAATSI